MKQVHSGPHQKLPRFSLLAVPLWLAAFPFHTLAPVRVSKKSRPSHGAKVAAGGPWGGSHCRRSVLPSVSAAPGIHGPRSQCGDAGHALLPVALATGCVAGGQEDAEYHGTQVRWVLIFSGPLCFWINGITFIFEASSYPTFLMITPRIGVRPMGKLT